MDGKHKWENDEQKTELECRGADCTICKSFAKVAAERHVHWLHTLDGNTQIEVKCQGPHCPFCAIGLGPGAIIFIRGCEYPGCFKKATHKTMALTCFCDEHYTPENNR